METNSEFLQEIHRLLASEDFENALHACTQALVRWPDDEALIYLMAVCEDRSGHSDAALARLEQLIDDSPEHVEARFERGRMLAARDRIAEARASLKGCVKLNPSHAAAWTLLARLDRYEGDPSSAVSGLKTALRADPDHVPALTSLAELMLERGDGEAANDYASRAVQASPADPHAQLGLARVLTAQGLRAFALRCVENAAGIAPDNSHVHNTAGYLFQRLGHHSAAAEAFARARRLGIADSGNAAALASSLARLGRLREARRVMREIPDDRLEQSLVLDLCDLYYQLGEVDALKELNGRLNTSASVSDEVRTWVEILLANLAGEVSRSLELAGKLAESTDLELRARSRMFAARMNLDQDDTDSAAALLAPLGTEKRLAPAAQLEVANLFRQAGASESAIELLQAMLDRSDISDEHKTLTRARLLDLFDRSGRYSDASSLLDEAAWQTPYLGEPGYLDLDEAIRGKLDSALQGLVPAKADPPSDTPRLIFVTGWPATGRDLIVSALALSEDVTALPQSDWQRRWQKLRLPIDPDRFETPDESEARQMRRGYLRGFTVHSCLLEPAVVQSVDLLRIAQLFPGSLVIVPHADERYLKFQWRLLGYRQIPSMTHAWAEEVKRLGAFRRELPLEFVDCQLETLLSDPRAALSELCQSLEIRFRSTMPEAFSAAFQRARYRAPDHWKNY